MGGSSKNIFEAYAVGSLGGIQRSGGVGKWHWLLFGWRRGELEVWDVLTRQHTRRGGMFPIVRVRFLGEKGMMKLNVSLRDKGCQKNSDRLPALQRPGSELTAV